MLKLSPAFFLRLKRCALYTAVFSLLAHGYRYLSLSFSGDAMLLSQVGEEAYQTSLGRFFQPVYWQIRGYITAPLLIGVLATVFLALSAALIAELFEWDRPLHLALACGVLAASETLAVSNATYLPWTDVYMLALLLCTMGVYAFFRLPLGWGFPISAALYCVSLGLYQSYLPCAATLIILLLMQDVVHSKSTSQVWRQGVLSIASLIAGLLLYAVLLKAILAVTDVSASKDYNGVGRVGLVALDQILPLLFGTYVDPLRLLFSLSDTPVMTWHITTVPQILNIAIFLPAAILLIFRARRLALPANLTLLFLVLVLPLGMNFIQFISKGIASGLTIYAYNLLYLLPIMLMEDIRLPRRPQALISGLCACLLALLIGHNTVVSNQMAVKRDLEFGATLSAFTRLLDHAEQTEGYVPGETPVVLMGILPSSRISMERPGFEDIAKAQGMRYTYGASYETSTYWYLQMALGESINLVGHDEQRRLSRSDAARSIPAYPDEGCCRMIDGVLYIRIS